MATALIEAHFLPSLEYFCALSTHETIVLEKHEHFVKQSYRNRCYLLTAHGIERLTVPLLARHGKVPIAAVQIDYTLRWQANLWRTITSAYAKAPFFEHYADELRKELFSGEPNLFELNRRLLSLCLTWLRWEKVLTESQSFDEQPADVDLRDVISAKSDYSTRPFYLPHVYQQVFGKAFVPNLSIVDLIFCVGPDAHRIIRSSTRKN